jgi:hypothetical protein
MIMVNGEIINEREGKEGERYVRPIRIRINIIINIREL